MPTEVHNHLRHMLTRMRNAPLVPPDSGDGTYIDQSNRWLSFMAHEPNCPPVVRDFLKELGDAWKPNVLTGSELTLLSHLSKNCRGADNCVICLVDAQEAM